MSSTTTLHSVLALTAVLVALIGIETVRDARDDRPAWPQNQKPPEEPLVFAHTERVCFPMFTGEERLTTFEHCERDQGEIVFGHDFVECWRGEPYEDRSIKLWTRQAVEQ